MIVAYDDFRACYDIFQREISWEIWEASQFDDPCLDFIDDISSVDVVVHCVDV